MSSVALEELPEVRKTSPDDVFNPALQITGVEDLMKT